MYEKIDLSFESLINHPMFILLVREYRHRFGIPELGFTDNNSEQYTNWIKEGLRKPDLLRSEFLFLAKRCRNLISDRDPVPNVVLAYYFLFNKKPTSSSIQNDYLFEIIPSGILGSFDLIFTVPLLFNKDSLEEKFQSSLEEIKKLISNSELAVQKLSESAVDASEFDQKYDLLATTPGNGGDIVDRVHRDIAYLVDLGRVGLRERLSRMKESDFEINTYDDKNKPIDGYTQMMGTWLLNRGLYGVSESYWANIDNEIVDFNQTEGKNVNRGKPLANLGVSQLAQGKVIEGLFNLYKAYDNDKSCLSHLPEVIIDPEKDLPTSDLYTQFENIQISSFFQNILSKYIQVFPIGLSEGDFKSYILSLSPEKKILLFITLYRFSFSYSLNAELSNPVNRGEILRSLSELALWYEDELKRKNPNLSGTLGDMLQTLFSTPINSTRGEYTAASSLTELETKINSAISNTADINFANARITTCVRNFTGHNFEFQNHVIFNLAGEIIARMFSLVMHSRSKGWV